MTIKAQFVGGPGDGEKRDINLPEGIQVPETILVKVQNPDPMIREQTYVRGEYSELAEAWLFIYIPPFPPE